MPKVPTNSLPSPMPKSPIVPRHRQGSDTLAPPPYSSPPTKTNDDNEALSPPSSAALTAAQKRKKNADAQAAFRARRANYIASLEETVTKLEQAARKLQDSLREAHDEIDDLRTENARLRDRLKNKHPVDPPQPHDRSRYTSRTTQPQNTDTYAGFNDINTTHSSGQRASSTSTTASGYNLPSPALTEGNYSNTPVVDINMPTYTIPQIPSTISSSPGHYGAVQSMAELPSQTFPFASPPKWNVPHPPPAESRDAFGSNILPYSNVRPGSHSAEPSPVHRVTNLPTTSSESLDSTVHVFPQYQSPVEDRSTIFMRNEDHNTSRLQISPSSSSFPHSPAEASGSRPNSASSSSFPNPVPFVYQRTSGDMEIDIPAVNRPGLEFSPALSQAHSSDQESRYEFPLRRAYSHPAADVPVVQNVSVLDMPGTAPSPIAMSSDKDIEERDRHRSRSRRQVHHSPSRDSRSPSPAPPPVSNTLAVIKARAFGTVRKARVRPRAPEGESAAQEVLEVLEARGIGMGLGVPSSLSSQSRDKRRISEHDSTGRRH